MYVCIYVRQGEELARFLWFFRLRAQVRYIFTL